MVEDSVKCFGNVKKGGVNVAPISDNWLNAMHEMNWMQLAEGGAPSENCIIKNRRRDFTSRVSKGYGSIINWRVVHSSFADWDDTNKFLFTWNYMYVGIGYNLLTNIFFTNTEEYFVYSFGNIGLICMLNEWEDSKSPPMILNIPGIPKVTRFVRSWPLARFNGRSDAS